MKPVNFFIGILWALLAAFPLHGAETTDMANARLSDFKLPQYNEAGKLVFILYGKSGYAAGINIFLENVLINLVQSNIKDIDAVRDLQHLDVYPLGSPAATITKFWADKSYCAALIYTSSAVYDRSTKTIKGDKDIHFRSQFLDIDGKGFDTDYNSKTIHIRKNVRIEIRQFTTGLGESHRVTADKNDKTDKEGSEK